MIKTLSGGNINGEINGKLVDIGGNAQFSITPGQTLYNTSDKDLLLKPGYSTVANGRADDIIVPANGWTKMVRKGSPNSFSKYEVGQIETK